MQYNKKQFSILSIVAITSFMGTFLISSVNIALPAIENSFNLNVVTLSWVITAFLLAMGIFLLPAGRLGDLTGIRKIFKIGVVVFTLTSIACGFAPNGIWLIILRFLQGIGAALTSTTGPAILVSSFPSKSRGRVLGISVAAVYLGLAFGPSAGGIITQQLGWRAIFFIASLIGMLTIFLSFRFLGKDENLKPNRRKIDLTGNIFYMFGLIALVYGSSEIPKIIGWILIFIGIIFIGVFWQVERKSERPVLDTKLFTKNRLFAFSNIAALINYSATFAIVFLLSLYLQEIQGLSPQYAGIILVAQPIIMAIFSPIFGNLSDKIEAQILATIGMSICTIGLILFAFLNATSPLWLIVLLLIWMGFGFALFSSPNMNTIMSSVSKTQYGLASGSASTMRVLGQITSMTVVTFLFAIIIGNQTIEKVSEPVFLAAMKWSFISFASISVFGIYFSYHRGKTQKTN